MTRMVEQVGRNASAPVRVDASLHGVHELTKAQARRIAVQAQLLDAERPAGLLASVRHLGFLQLDPIAAVAPSADLVAWSRLGSSYDPAELRTALADRTLIELQALIRPAEDLALYRADMAVWPGTGTLRPWQVERRAWVKANDACRRDILRRLKASGPLLDARAARHVRGAVGLDRVDQQPQRREDARPHGGAGRGRGRRPARDGASLGPGGAGLPRRSGRPRRGGGAHPQRATAPRARHRASPRDAEPGGAVGRGRGG